MVKKRRTLRERFRRLKRIIRFLSRRGTLFRSRPAIKTDVPPKPLAPRKKSWRPFRKMRYLMRHGSLFRSKRSIALTRAQQSLQPGIRKKDTRFSLYRAYRQVRYLVNTGRLFRIKKRRKHEKKRMNKNIRLIGFLIRRGILFKVISDSIGYYRKDFFNTMFRSDYLKIILNSTILFLLAYFIVFSVTSFSSSLAALSYDIRSVIYYDAIDFLISARGWSVDQIRVVYSAGPFFSLIVSLLMLVLYINIAEETWMIRLFIFWMFCHAFTHFFGEMLVGILLTKGFGLTVAYMFLSEYKELIIIMVCISSMIIAGLMMTKIALFSGNIYFKMITRENRPYFLQGQFLIPYLLGLAIIVLLKMPKITEYDLLINLSMILIIVPLVIRGLSMKDIYFDPATRKITIRFKLLFLLLIVLVLFRIILAEGFSVG